MSYIGLKTSSNEYEMNTTIFWLTGPTNQSRPIANFFNFYIFCLIWMKFGMWTTIRKKNNIEWVWDSYGYFLIDPNRCPSQRWWWHQRQSRQREQWPSSSSTGLYNFFPKREPPFVVTLCLLALSLLHFIHLSASNILFLAVSDLVYPFICL